MSTLSTETAPESQSRLVYLHTLRWQRSGSRRAFRASPLRHMRSVHSTQYYFLAMVWRSPVMTAFTLLRHSSRSNDVTSTPKLRLDGFSRGARPPRRATTRNTGSRRSNGRFRSANTPRFSSRGSYTTVGQLPPVKVLSYRTTPSSSSERRTSPTTHLDSYPFIQTSGACVVIDVIIDSRISYLLSGSFFVGVLLMLKAGWHVEC